MRSMFMCTKMHSVYIPLGVSTRLYTHVRGLFPAEVIKPALGSNNVLYVVGVSAFADMLGSLGFGRLADTWGRLPVLTIAVVCNSASSM
jgi:MFS family permease